MKKTILTFNLFLGFLLPFSMVAQIDTIFGKIIDENGLPLNGVQVEIPKLRSLINPTGSVSDGSFQLEVNGIGTTGLLVFKSSLNGYVPSFDTTEIEASGRTRKYPFRLYKKLDYLRGRIINQAGYPIPGLRVELMGYTTANGSRLSTTVDRLGDFLLDLKDGDFPIHNGKTLQLAIFRQADNRLLKEVITTPNQYGHLFNFILDTIFPDTDNDGIRDNADSCPCQYAETRSGCLNPPQKYLWKAIPGVYDKEWWISGIWVGSIIYGSCSIRHLNQLQEDMRNATSGSEIDMINDKKAFWRWSAIASGSGLVLSYVLDNLNLNRDESCLQVGPSSEGLGIGLLIKLN